MEQQQKYPKLTLKGRIANISRKGQEQWKLNLIVEADAPMDFAALNALMDNPADITIVGAQATMFAAMDSEEKTERDESPLVLHPSPVMCRECGSATGSIAEENDPDGLCQSCRQHREG